MLLCALVGEKRAVKRGGEERERKKRGVIGKSAANYAKMSEAHDKQDVCPNAFARPSRSLDLDNHLLECIVRCIIHILIA